MPFVPLQSTGSTDPSFPRVTPEQQSERDGRAAAIVADELENATDPQQRATLEKEYRLRFGGEPPAPRRGFIPLADVDQAQPARQARGFTPIDNPEPERPSMLKQIALNNPLAAAVEAGANLASQAVALPVAGIAGLATEAARAVGLADRKGADVVERVAGAMTYQPRGEMGKAAAEVVAYPFEKLAEAGQWAGGKTLEATDSPLAATAVDTAVNALPMLVSPAKKGAVALKERITGKPAPEVAPSMATAQEVPAAVAAERRGFVPLESAPEASTVKAGEANAAPAWIAFSEDSGALGIPRADMPQIKAEHRGALVNFLKGKGIEGSSTEVPASNLKPTQAEYAPGKVERWAKDGESSRSILTSSDGYILDGHHQWVAALESGQPVKVIQFNAPIGELLGATDEFPSVRRSKGATNGQEGIAGTERLARDAEALHEQTAQGFQPLRSEGDNGLPGMGGELRGLPDGHGAGADVNALAGQAGRAGELRSGELHLDNARGTAEAPRVLSHGNNRPAGNDSRGGWEAIRAAEPERGTSPAGVRVAADAGRGSDGSPIAMGDLQRPDAPASRVGEALRAVDGDALESYPARLDARASADATKPARIYGRYASSYTDAELIRLKETTKSNTYRADIDAEIARRNPGAPAGDMPAEGKVNSWVPGASYVGFIDDTPRPGTGGAGTAPATTPATGARAKPIRREDVLIPFAKALGTGIYEGRIKQKGVMGHFRPKLEEVRIKRHADLETAAHELAHLIDYRVPEIRKSWTQGPNWQTHRAELKGLSYDAGKVYEGFAEFVRHYMTQPDVAQTRAPTFYKWFEDFVSRSEYGPAIDNARKGMTDWFNQDAIDRARSKIGDHDPMTKALDNRWDALRQSTVDDLHGIYRMERELKQGHILPNGAYESARLSRASASIADGALRFGAPVKNADGSFGWKGKGLQDILRPVSEHLDDALLYFVGRSSRELMNQGREHLFTKGEVDAMLKLRRPEFDQAFKEYQAWNSAVLDFAEAHGVINPEARALWQRTEYMPFHRVGSPEGGFKGKPGDWTGIKALTGGTENLRDILSNMVSNAAMLIDKSVKNEARQKVSDLADKSHGGGKFMIKIPPESRPVKVQKAAVIDAMLKSMGIDKSNPAAAAVEKRIRKMFNTAPGMIDVLQTNTPPAGGNVVAVLREGKPTWYEVGDPLLLRSLEAIDRPVAPWVVKWLGLPKRIGQATITLTPDFMIANIARDTIMGSIMSRAGFRPVMDSLQGMRLRLKNDPLYQEYIANGGGLSSIYLEEGKFKAKLEKFYQDRGINYRTVLDAPDKLLGFIETLGDAFEMSTRLGEYKRAIDRGEHPRHAAYLGRDVSTDFAMRGDSKALGFMYDTVMFLRPALISWDRLARGLAHDPNKGAIATKAGLLALSSAALYLLNREDPRYQDLPDWDRDANWHFFIGDQHFRYPKIWEIGALSSAAERTAEKIIEGDPQGLGKDFARILGATFSLNFMPQIVAPLAEQATNRNSFTKAPLETPGMKNVQPFMRAKPTTSETLKAAGMATRNLPEALQVNPVRAEALLRGYFNTWALYGLGLSDRAFFGDKLPEARTDQLPVLRRFYSQDPAQHTKYETMFYDMLGEAQRLQGTMRELDKIGRPEIADEKERNPMAGEGKPLERAARNLQGINADMRKVRRDDAMSPEEKRTRLDALTVQRNDLLKRAVKDTQAAMKERQQ